MLPLPLREGAGGRGCTQYPCETTPPPSPLPQGEEEEILPSTVPQICEFVPPATTAALLQARYAFCAPQKTGADPRSNPVTFFRQAACGMYCPHGMIGTESKAASW